MRAGLLIREQDEADGRRLLWTDDGLCRLPEHGDVDLDDDLASDGGEPVEMDDLTDDEVRQLARSTLYTWELTNIDADEPSTPPTTPADDNVTTGGADPPPRTTGLTPAHPVFAPAAASPGSAP